MIIALNSSWLLELHEALSWFLGKLLNLFLSLILLVKLLLKWVSHLVQTNLWVAFQSVLESLRLLTTRNIILKLLIQLLWILSLVLTLQKLLDLVLVSLKTHHWLPWLLPSGTWTTKTTDQTSYLLRRLHVLLLTLAWIHSSNQNILLIVLALKLLLGIKKLLLDVVTSKSRIALLLGNLVLKLFELIILHALAS